VVWGGVHLFFWTRVFWVCFWIFCGELFLYTAALSVNRRHHASQPMFAYKVGYSRVFFSSQI
jgi:hypothetical protein